MTSTERTAVLVAGGGLVGLSTALFLEHHGVPYVLVERREHASVLPRSRGVHTRTMEMFRQVGVERRVEQVGAKALRAGVFGGARQGATIASATRLDLGKLRAAMANAAASPSGFCFAPQVLLEPALADVLRERGGDVHFGTELTDFTVHERGVVAQVRDNQGESSIHADYLIAADGANSPIRQRLGIDGWTLRPRTHYINAFARVDLTGVLGGESFSQCDIRNDRVNCLILAKNNTDEWTFHIEYDPERESPADFSDERCVDLIRAAIGISDIAVEVLAKSAWDTGVFVARDYRRGPVFLVGDAAHRHSPWGGFGANTGIADAHNLVWKIASVLAGTAGPALLHSYTAERQPQAFVAAEQAYLGEDFATRYGIATENNADELARQLDFGVVMSQFRYASTAVFDSAASRWPAWSHSAASSGHVAQPPVLDSAASRWPAWSHSVASSGHVAQPPVFGGESAGHVPELTGQVGTRVPHLWIDAEERVSTLDLPATGFALLVAGPADEWRDAAAAARQETGIEISVDQLPVESWCARTELPAGGALLVRPDMIVAARSDRGLDPSSLPSVLRVITGLGAKEERSEADPVAARSA
ncbi:FAD-dependent oxidoreductase [Nocardia panacis]|uniref:FAD-dependent oxidoreductase n=1 Tax=Nocardia panacis TaxID=2340916 RepID=A0A3A4JZN8_9NOCA|nr:FAD-dependent monooxygenase [Nocardia panacis]RJO76935.1 FAD-dependent oxidoreductase [Nocardia panacis]